MVNIYSLNNFHLKLKINTYNDTDYFLNLNDGTFIFSCFEGMKRYLIKTMEELPQIIKFNSNYYDDDYYDYCDYDYENYVNYIYLNENNYPLLKFPLNSIAINNFYILFLY